MTTLSCVALWGMYIYSSMSCHWEPWQHWAVPLCEGRTSTHQWAVTGNHDNMELCHSVRDEHLLINELSLGTMTTWSCEGRRSTHQQAVTRNHDNIELCRPVRDVHLLINELSPGTMTTLSCAALWGTSTTHQWPVNMNHDNIELCRYVRDVHLLINDLSTWTMTTRRCASLWGTYLYSSMTSQQEPWLHWAVSLCQGHTSTYQRAVNGNHDNTKVCSSVREGHLLINELSTGTMTTLSCVTVSGTYIYSSASFASPWGSYIYSSTSCQQEPWQHGALPLREGCTSTHQWPVIRNHDNIELCHCVRDIHLLINELSMGTMTTLRCAAVWGMTSTHHSAVNGNHDNMELSTSCKQERRCAVVRGMYMYSSTT